jgi:hypothetical protein
MLNGGALAKISNKFQNPEARREERGRRED